MKGEAKRRALGKGLGSLIPDFSGDDPLVKGSHEPESAAGTPAEVPLDEIQPNPQQPRQNFNPDEIDSLSASIRASGILQPLLVRREKDGTYTLIAGERRLRAARLAGLESVPAFIRDIADERLLEFALVENLQRDDLGPVETALAFRALIRRFRLTQAEVASRVGKPRSSVANFLRLLDLPESVQRLLENGKLDMGHGRALAGLEDPADQEKLAARAVLGDWSVRRIEKQVRKLLGKDDELGSPATTARPDPNVVAAEESLSRALGARITIQQKKSGGGRIEIRFAGEEDLDRLYRLLTRLEGS